jgi:hypothetical protein
VEIPHGLASVPEQGSKAECIHRICWERDVNYQK